MGWPLAVSAALMQRRATAFASAIASLALGHFAAMLALLLPFALLAPLLAWQRSIRLAAACLLIAGGILLALRFRRHPRLLARIRPGQLALWSFAIALAHGAALMLLPIYLGLCRTDPAPGHAAAATLIQGSLAIALAVALVHATAAFAAAAALGWLVYRHLGLQALRHTWFDLDLAWAASLVLVGAVAFVLAV